MAAAWGEKGLIELYGETGTETVFGWVAKRYSDHDQLN